jgi:hypothetical protein
MRTATTVGLASHSGADVKTLQDFAPVIRLPGDAVKSALHLHPRSHAVTSSTATLPRESVQGPKVWSVRSLVRLAHHHGSEVLSAHQTVEIIHIGCLGGDSHLGNEHRRGSALCVHVMEYI